MKFKKTIVKEGVYSIEDPNGPIAGPDGKKYRLEQITESRIKHWANTHSAMRKKGLSIPAPVVHDQKAVPVVRGTDGTLPRSDVNKGWWEKLWVENGKDGAILKGEVDIEDDVAKKIGKTIKEVSVYERPAFRTGDGSDWNDALMHIALVTHPVEPNQSNFEPVKEGVSLSMSHRLKMAEVPPSNEGTGTEVTGPNSSVSIKSVASGDSIQDLIKNLQSIAKIALPDDTTDENLIERLNAALIQKQTSEQGEGADGTTTSPPGESREQPAPVAMSFSPKQIDRLIKDKAVNPETDQPYTKNDLAKIGVADTAMSHPSYQAQVAANQALLTHVSNQHKSALHSRVEKLVSSRRTTKEYAEQSLLPLIDGFAMSFTDEGAISPTPIDTVLSALEAQPSPSSLGTIADVTSGPPNLSSHTAVLNALAMSQGGGLPGGINLNEESGGMDDLSPISEDDAESVATKFLQNTGVEPVTVTN